MIAMLTGPLSSVHQPWTHGDAPREPRQRPTRLITRDFRVPRPPRRPDFARSASSAYEFVHFRCWNREPETFRGARSPDARRDNPRARPRRSARHSATPLCWPTARDLHARNPLSQKRVRVAQNANAPAGRPGRSLLTCWRASFARASWSRESETGFEQASWLPIRLAREIPLWRVDLEALVRLERTGFPQKYPLRHTPASAGQSFVAASSIASSAGSSSATVFQSRSKSTPR